MPRGKREVPQRLSKVIAAAGLASRRAAEDLIFDGKVAVNKVVVTIPQTMVMPSKDQIVVDGRALPREVGTKYYFAVNKPKGYLCASKAERKEGEGQRVVVDLFDEWYKRWRRETPDPKAIKPRFFTVGRLDVASTGLLFVTNDGSWAQRVAHPSSGLTKEYVVTLSTLPTRAQLETIGRGMMMDDVLVQPVWVMPIVGDPPGRHRIRIVVSEGRNHEVRNLVANAQLEVVYLKRVRVGGYRLPRELGLGQIRQLKPREVAQVVDRGAQSNPSSNPFAL